MTYVRFWILLAVVAAAGLLITLSSWVAWHEHQNATTAAVSYAAVLRLKAQTEQAARLRYQPVPRLRTVNTYGAPYNFTIVCTVKGSSAAGDTRVPLDPDVGPTVGDVYVKTCRAFALSEAPVG